MKTEPMRPFPGFPCAAAPPSPVPAAAAWAPAVTVADQEASDGAPSASADAATAAAVDGFVAMVTGGLDAAHADVDPHGGATADAADDGPAAAAVDREALADAADARGATPPPRAKEPLTLLEAMMSGSPVGRLASMLLIAPQRAYAVELQRLYDEGRLEEEGPATAGEAWQVVLLGVFASLASDLEGTRGRSAFLRTAPAWASFVQKVRAVQAFHPVDAFVRACPDVPHGVAKPPASTSTADHADVGFQCWLALHDKPPLYGLLLAFWHPAQLQLMLHLLRLRYDGEPARLPASVWAGDERLQATLAFCRSRVLGAGKDPWPELDAALERGVVWRRFREALTRFPSDTAAAVESPQRPTRSPQPPTRSPQRASGGRNGNGRCSDDGDGSEDEDEDDEGEEDDDKNEDAMPAPKRKKTSSDGAGASTHGEYTCKDIVEARAWAMKALEAPAPNAKKIRKLLAAVNEWMTSRKLDPDNLPDKLKGRRKGVVSKLVQMMMVQKNV